MPLLLLILAAAPAHVIKDHFVVLLRLQGRQQRGAAVMALWTVAELGGAVVGGLAGGIVMLCLGWAAMSTACAIIALPMLLREMRRQPDGDTTLRDRVDEVAAGS